MAVGIPFRMKRGSDEGDVDKVVYLATARYGEGGAALSGAKKAYRKKSLEVAKLSRRYALVERRLDKLEVTDLQLDPLSEKRDAMLDAFAGAEEAVNEEAQKIVLLSLTEGYGREKAEEILNQFTDGDMQAAVETIQTGEQPADFFPSSEQPPKLSTTSPSGDTPADSSSITDSADGSGKKATSE